jgi:hypothetical protein
MEESSKQPYLGDLAKTDTIFKLIQTPPEQRNDIWNDLFLDCLPGASFRCGDPQVIIGPDGYPYFQLFLPEPGVEFQCFVIEHIKDTFLLENGLGVVINPSGTGADWVLTYGDILNLHLNNTFYTKEHSFATHKEREVIDREEQVMVAQPSEELLPLFTRAILKEYLKSNGIAIPKVLLMMRTIDGKMTQDIVFNITKSNFDNEDTFEALMASLRWFLPLHYSYVGMEEKVFDRAFVEL